MIITAFLNFSTHSFPVESSNKSTTSLIPVSTPDTATLNDVEKRSEMDMFIRWTIRLTFIAVSPREHGSLTLLILPRHCCTRGSPRMGGGDTCAFLHDSKSQTVETDIFSRGDIHPRLCRGSPGPAFVRDPTTTGFCIYAHAAARNPILEHRGKKRDEPIRSPKWVSRPGRAGGERLPALKVPDGIEYVCTWARDNGCRNSITRTAS